MLAGFRDMMQAVTFAYHHTFHCGRILKLVKQDDERFQATLCRDFGRRGDYITARNAVSFDCSGIPDAVEFCRSFRVRDVANAV